jgi:hypothetical protein
MRRPSRTTRPRASIDAVAPSGRIAASCLLNDVFFHIATYRLGYSRKINLSYRGFEVFLIHRIGRRRFPRSGPGAGTRAACDGAEGHRRQNPAADQLISRCER